ncbi:glycosyltransferase family 2 protein [Treponema sp.]|uniref:glycosyltransferase family 2 protein n=1 Tax=Treponema sp. TaxID=166 RepID=UPI0025FB87E5|nr:glycosyltransferase family 2 protein [Treponema sp.]MBR4323222.1 glycosyltransferase family 2 protein [Treponema sp.]
MTLISVIIPVYNTAHYLSRCITSVLAQTYQIFEVILVDDGSTDNSLDICRKFSETDSRIKLYHKENGGLSSARNFGIEQSSGEFIVFLDSDDMIASFFLETMLVLQKKYNADIVSCLFKSFSSEDGIIEPSGNSYEKIYDGRAACKALFLPDFNRTEIILTSACGKLIKSNIVKKNLFPNGRNHEDVATVYKYLYSSVSVVSTTKEMYLYFFNRDGITKKPSKKTLSDDLWARRERALFFNSKGEKSLWKLSLYNYGALLLSYLLNESLEQEELKESYSYFHKNSCFFSLLKWKIFFAYNFPKLSSFFKAKKRLFS